MTGARTTRILAATACAATWGWRRPCGSRRRATTRRSRPVALAWTLAWPGVTGAIVGARRPSQVDGWLPAATVELDQADLDTIASAIQRTGAGTGPARPVRGPRTFLNSSAPKRSGREAA